MTFRSGTTSELLAGTDRVGYWQVGGPGGLQIYIKRKPNFITRLLCKHLLDWEWKE
jgi:hypothetical protein